MTRQQKFLLIISPILVISTTFWASFSAGFFDKTAGYISVNLIYWGIFCIPGIIFITNGKKQELIAMYIPKTTMGKNKLGIYNLTAFLPVLPVCIVAFIPVIKTALALPIIIALVYAVFNGFIEELFWRGLFNKAFDDNIIFAFIYPTVMFSGWHIALILVKGMVYTGGNIALLAGASFMGVLWGFIAYKTKSVRYTTAAHIITNFFAFSGLIYENWFL